MPVKRSSTRRSASGSPASRGAAVSARAAEGPLPAAACVGAAIARASVARTASGGARMGRGIFIRDVASGDPQNPDRWMLHQAANDGFRGLFLVCFDGPSAAANGPSGLVILSNGDNDAMLFNMAMARAMLEALEPAGFDLGRVPDVAAGFDTSAYETSRPWVDLDLAAFVELADAVDDASYADGCCLCAPGDACYEAEAAACACSTRCAAAACARCGTCLLYTSPSPRDC